MFNLQNFSARLTLLVLTSLGLVACGNLNQASNSVAGLVTPYKIDIVQGNFVSKEQVAALQTGMSRAQVRDIMGTPLLTSIFHADRWDYIFTFKRQGTTPQARNVTLFFKGDLLERIEADPLPTENEFVASLDSGKKTGPAPVLEMTAESLRKLPPPVKAAPPKQLPPLPSSYPPLEPAAR